MWSNLGGVLCVVMGSTYAVIMKLRHLFHDRAYFGTVVPNAVWLPKGALALTLGNTVYVRNWPPLPGIIAHEAEHVVQFRRWGFFGFLWRYGQELVLYGYEHSPIEAEARAVEKRRI